MIPKQRINLQQSIFKAKVDYCKLTNPTGYGPCPKCGSDTVIKIGRNGKFWGCTEFPLCKGSRNWEEGDENNG